MSDEIGIKPLQITGTFHRCMIPKCPSCGAPGRYSSHESIRDGWVGCYVPPGDVKDGQSIIEGECPNCHTERPSVIEYPQMEFTP